MTSRVLFLIAVFIYTVDGYCVPVPCPENWINFEDKCYKFLTTKSESNWYQAFRSCVLEHNGKGNLIRIQSQEEMTFIKNIIKGDEDLSLNMRFWTSMNDITKDDKLKYAPEDTPVTFTQWGKNEPNNLKGRERCINLLSIRDYDMNDAFCSKPGIPICEISATAQPFDEL